ncbi:MAG: hypothetical protein ABIK62_01665 [candidate division WOR-3 bacterium]
MKFSIRLWCAVVFALGSVGQVAGQWSPPINVTRVTEGGAGEPSLAVDSSGTLHASWTHGNGSPAREWIEYGYKTMSMDTWSLPQHVTRDSFVGLSSVIVIGPGRVPCVVWQSYLSAGHLFISRKCGDTWSIPQRLTSCNRLGESIRGTADRSGRIHVVWHEANLRNIWHAVYEDTSWALAETIVHDSTGWPGIGAPDVKTDFSDFAHVVYSNNNGGVSYMHQTPTGWTEPNNVTGSAFTSSGPRLALDDADRPQVIWLEAGSPFFSSWTGDSWTTITMLDPGISPPPSLCMDLWSRVHAFYSPSNLLERVRDRSLWQDPILVDSSEGYADVLVARERVHAIVLRGYGSPGSSDLWYTYRHLDPPAILEAQRSDVRLAVLPCLCPVIPRTEVDFEISRPSDVVADVLDTTGRCLRQVSLGQLDAGRHTVRPHTWLPGKGIFFLRLRAGSNTREIKLVRED